MNEAQHTNSGRDSFIRVIGAGMAVLGISLSGLAVGQDANWNVHPLFRTVGRLILERILPI